MPDLVKTSATVQESPKVVCLTLAGEAGAAVSLEVEQFFDAALQKEQPRHLLLDLTGLTFAGSAFFSALLFLREELTKGGGRLVLYGLRPEIASTMRLLALDRMMQIRPDQQAALTALA